jgi:hypothetical protein
LEANLSRRSLREVYLAVIYPRLNPALATALALRPGPPLTLTPALPLALTPALALTPTLNPAEKLIEPPAPVPAESPLTRRP